MKKSLLLLLFAFLFFSKLNAQSSIEFRIDTCNADLGTGDGKDGAGNSLNNILAGNYTLDANGNFTSTGNVLIIIAGTGNNVLNFHDFTLGAGHYLSVNDVVSQGPLIIKCTGKATIAGTIDLKGSSGGNGIANGCVCSATIAGGTAGVGGTCGGVGGGKGASASYTGGVGNAVAGVSYGSFSGGGALGKKGPTLGGGGGGGGGASYGVSGAAGGKGSNGDFAQSGGAGGAAGTVYGDPNLTTIYNGTNLFGGSGGGGGGAATGNPDVTTGGGGGGGGGAVQVSAHTIDFTGGLINVSGGNGGAGAAGCPNCSAHQGAYAAGGGGGGGSGGTVSIQYVDTCTACVAGPGINISGGTGGVGGSAVDGKTGGAGGNGGDGRLLIAQVCPLTTAVTKNSADEINIFPNPFSTNVTFTFGKEQIDAQLELSDITGRTIRNIHFSGKQLTIQRDELPTGVYIYKYFSGSKGIEAGKIIVQ